MLKETYRKNGDTYVRINKARARKLYNAGKVIYLLSEFMTFDSVWGSPCPIDNNRDDFDSDFDRTVTNFQYYNCDKERGHNVKYFAKMKDV